jgi:hypothetical protein
MDEQFNINGTKAENESEEYPDNGVKETDYIETTIELKEKKPKPRRWKFFLAALGIIMVAELSYLAWNNYLSPEAKYNRETKANYDAYIKFTNQYETAMKNDTYGGKTPQETLDMFIDALKKGDMELASKYFVLQEDGNRDSDILNVLQKNKDDEESQNLLAIVQKLVPSSVDTGSEDSYIFFVPDSQGMADYSMFLKRNEYSQIWKIESF